MGSSKQIILLVILLMSNIAAWSGGKNDPPDDIPTIEALIDAHKRMQKAEDLAVLELGYITTAQSFSQKAAAKYNETRKMLNQRLADVGSALTLASSIASITMQLKDLTETYADFTKTTYNNAKRHPFLLLIYTSTNAQVAKEIEHITKCCIDFAGFQTNVFKSTMNEKRQLLGFISANIASIQRILNRASLTCRSMLATGVQEYHVWDLVNSKTNQEIINKVIAKWKTKAG